MPLPRRMSFPRRPAPAPSLTSSRRAGPRRRVLALAAGAALITGYAVAALPAGPAQAAGTAARARAAHAAAPAKTDRAAPAAGTARTARAAPAAAAGEPVNIWLTTTSGS